MKIFYLRAVFSILFLFDSSISLAAEVSSRTPELGAGSVMIQVLTGLGFVTVAIFGLAWIAKRLGGARFTQQSEMNVLAVMPLGAREKVVLIDIANTKILLGVTSSNISRLHVFDYEECSDEREQELQTKNITASIEGDDHVKNKWDFSHYIKQFSKKNISDEVKGSKLFGDSSISAKIIDNGK